MGRLVRRAADTEEDDSGLRRYSRERILKRVNEARQRVGAIQLMLEDLEKHLDETDVIYSAMP